MEADLLFQALDVVDKMTSDNIKNAKHNLNFLIKKALYNKPAFNNLDAMAALADEYDNSNNPILQRQADIIDQVLLDMSKKAITVKDLEFIAITAAELDNTGDPELIKEASVLDELLLTLAAPKDAKYTFKAAEDKEIDRLREKYNSEALEKVYITPKKVIHDDIKTADAVKALKDKVKEYRPLEAPLSTRTCPDHPGAQVMRVADGIYRCELDNKIYNYQSGFSTMKGNKIPGGDVSEQTKAMGDRATDNIGYDTRETRLNT